MWNFNVTCRRVLFSSQVSFPQQLCLWKQAELTNIQFNQLYKNSSSSRGGGKVENPISTGSCVLFPQNHSTLPLLRKSAKVKSFSPAFFAVEMCRNCGVERENFLKILWKIPPPEISFHSLWNAVFVKKWNFCRIFSEPLEFA